MIHRGRAQGDTGGLPLKFYRCTGTFDYAFCIGLPVKINRPFCFVVADSGDGLMAPVFHLKPPFAIR